MKKQQSALLTKFYRSYLAWVNSGAVVGGVFTPDHGLCHNLALFMVSENRLPGPTHEELYDQFALAGLHITLPFDEDLNSYYDGKPKYENEKRLQWVKDHVCLFDVSGGFKPDEMITITRTR